MKFEGENFSSIQNPTDKILIKRLKSLRSYSKHSCASLTNEKGDYIQVAGGGASCMIEKYESTTGNRFRAFQNEKHPLFPDGTELFFGAGKLKLKADEWFIQDKMIDIFLSFNNERDFPKYVLWRKSPGF